MISGLSGDCSQLIQGFCLPWDGEDDGFLSVSIPIPDVIIRLLRLLVKRLTDGYWSSRHERFAELGATSDESLSYTLRSFGGDVLFSSVYMYTLFTNI
jgi:hypothetical protein